jgi:hypothetical protein
LNTRGILAGAPVPVISGQQLRIIYNVIVTVGPTTPVTKSASISGWPSLQHPVVADASTDLITLVAHGFAANTAVFLQGTTPPGGLSFGTTYYVLSNTADTFKLAATPSGSAIDITSNGSGVILFTNTNGREQLIGVGLSQVDVNGNSTTLNIFPICEPKGIANAAIGLSTDTTAFPTWSTASASTPVYASLSVSGDTYTNGSYTRTARVTFSTIQGNSSVIRKIATGFGSSGSIFDGPCFFFDQNQEKTNLYTLTLVYRWTWDRNFS